MSSPYSHIRPNTYLFLRLPTEALRLIEIKLNTIIEVGKLGSFPSNLLLGRPYHCTYEILEKTDGELYSRLRVVPTSELNAEAGLEDVTPAESRGDPGTPSTANALPASYDLLSDDGKVLMKNNRLTVDDASRQTLSQDEIEELKKSAAGKEIVERILASHIGLDEKTAYAKAKYTLRKHRKYLKRFTVLPMNLGNLIEYILGREPSRIMDLREETVGLIAAWSHAHFSGIGVDGSVSHKPTIGGRWLAVDDTGGLVVAALAERMGFLHSQQPHSNLQTEPLAHPGIRPGEAQPEIASNGIGTDSTQAQHPTEDAKSIKDHRDFPIPAETNTVTLIHPAVQPNLSILKYFGYDTSTPNVASLEAEHPLHTHLKQLSWLQLLHPEEDPLYVEPEPVTEQVLSTWKSGKRGAYFKKRRRWQRCKAIVDEARGGGFEGLVIASHMDPVGILQHTIPLVQGGGHIVIYSPTIEPLVRAMDLYSKERRAAYILALSRGEVPDEEDFPVDPRLLLAPSLQTSRIREWQVLPGRTHPLMTARGGAEGYVLTARKVIPLDGGVEARGNFSAKRRKVMSSVSTT